MQVPELLEEVAVALLDPEELRQLADDDRQREADDEALEHRLGDEVARKPSRSSPAISADQPVTIASAGGERDELARAPAWRSRATAAAESAAVADIGPTTRWLELPKAA